MTSTGTNPRAIFLKLVCWLAFETEPLQIACLQIAGLLALIASEVNFVVFVFDV